MSGTLRRVTLITVLCALILSVSWLLLPSRSEHAERAADPAPGVGAGKATPEERSQRSSRKHRPDASPSPSPAAPRSTRRHGDAALESAVIDVVNSKRTDAGCDPVRHEPRLAAAAQRHSADMARRGELDHTGDDGSSFIERAERAGYHQAMSENIAMGYRTARKLVNAWMESPNHRENILACEATAVGVGVARESRGAPYWTQMFGRA